MHGTNHVFFVLTSRIKVVTFSNYLIHFKLELETWPQGDLWNMLSYWSLLCIRRNYVSSPCSSKTGPAGGVGLFYPRFPAVEQAIPGSGLGMTLWLVALTSLHCIFLLASIRTISLQSNQFDEPRMSAFALAFAIDDLGFPSLLR